jgi:HK97 family phage major capsid protein
MPDNTSRTRELTFSSEYKVKRWFGIEILDHTPDSVRMDFLKSGRAPFLLDHDQRAVVGVIESASIDPKTKRGRATVRFGSGKRASEVLADVDEGIRPNVSTGYRVHELVLEKQSDSGDDEYRVTDWEPLEGSSVGIPADPDVGFERSVKLSEVDKAPPASVPSLPSRSVSSTPAIAAVKESPMSDVDNKAPAGPSADTITAVEAEKQRREAVQNLCKANKIDARVEHRWIVEGASLNEVARELVDVLEERGKARPALAAELGLSTTDTKRFSLFRAIRALKYGAQSPKLIADAAFEMECSRAVAEKLGRGDSTSILIPAEILMRNLGPEAMQRAMATQPGAKGGYLVNVSNGGFIDILRARSVATNMGARVVSGLVGNVMFPRQTGKATVTWQAGEGTNVAATDQALGQLSMTPKTAIAITDVSEQLLRQSSPSAEAFVMADLARDIAIDGVDYCVINGTGGAQPLGVKNTTGVTTGQDAATATYAKVLAFPGVAGTANAIRGNPGWVTNTVGATKLMQVQRFSGTDTPIWSGNMLDGELVGFRAMSSEQLASGNLIFGSWDEIVIGEWGVLEIATDNGGTRFNQAQVGIRAMWMLDVMVRYPQAFVVSTNLS